MVDENKMDVETCRAMIELSRMSNQEMIEMAHLVVERAVGALRWQPPCGFSVVGIGSLGRGEATPYSDIEYLFLVEDKTQIYFEQLAVLTYFLIGAFNETKLSSLDITEIKGWYVDERPHGYQIDGITKSAGNVPTRHSDKPNQFINTPEGLLDIYKLKLHNPDKESLRGDVTAMVRYTSAVYSYGNGAELLESFDKQRRELDCTTNDKRVQSDLAMLCGDLKRHKLCPQYDDYTVGFNTSVKATLYRLPSLLSLNTAIVLGLSLNSSWETFDRFRQDSSLMVRYLQRTLAVACFFRLKCYLTMRDNSSEFEVCEEGESQAEDTPKHGGRNFVFEERKLWSIERKGFGSLCESLLAIQHHCTKYKEKLVTKQSLQLLMEQELQTPRWCYILARFFCSEWPLVIEEDVSQVNNSEGGEYVAYAVARSLLQVHQYEKALPLFDRLTEVSGSSLNVDVTHLVDVHRGRAKCHFVRGNVREALLSMAAADGLCKPPNAEEETMAMRKLRATVRFELTNIQTPSSCPQSDSLDKLFDVLAELVLVAALPGGSKGTEYNRLISDFNDSGPMCRLDFVSNPSREVAVCVFTIAEIYQYLQEKELAQAYFDKARSLDLKLVLDNQIDGFTAVTILRKWKTPKTLKFARRIIQSESEGAPKEKIAFEEAKILLDEADCSINSTSTKCEHKELNEVEVKQLSKRVGSDLQYLSSSVNGNQDSNLEVMNQIKGKFDSAKLDLNHVLYGNLQKLRGDLAAKNCEFVKAHEYYQKSIDVFTNNRCKTAIAEVIERDADVYEREQNVEKAEQRYSEVQRVLQEVRVSTDERYLDIMRKRTEILMKTGRHSEAQKLVREAEPIEYSINETKKRLLHKIKMGKQKGM